MNSVVKNWVVGKEEAVGVWVKGRVIIVHIEGRDSVYMINTFEFV